MDNHHAASTAVFEYTTEYFTWSTEMEDSTTQLVARNVSSYDFKSTVVKSQFLLYDILIPLIGSIIIIANLLVVVSSGLILKKGQEPRSTYLFLGNVAMTDLITGIAVVFGQLFPKKNRDHTVCTIAIGMIVAPTLASIFSVALIAVDRFLYILYGMKYSTWVYPNRARMLIGITWVLGCLIGFIPLMGWAGDTNNGKWCWFIRVAPPGVIILTVIAGAIPLLLIFVLYSVILYHAIKKITQLRNADTNRNNYNTSVSSNPSSNLRIFRGGKQSDVSDSEDSTAVMVERKGIQRFFKKKPSNTVSAPNKWKAIKVVMFTTGSFIVTWVPYFLASSIYAYQCGNDTKSKKCDSLRLLIASPLAILGFMNSLINPIIYAWWHKGFRQFVKKKFDIFKMNTRGGTPATSQTNTKSETPSKTMSSSHHSIVMNNSESSQDETVKTHI